MAQLPLIFNLNYQRIWLADLKNGLIRQPILFYYLKFATINNHRKHFFEKLPFLDPHLFWLTSRIYDDTFFGGTNEPP